MAARRAFVLLLVAIVVAPSTLAVPPVHAAAAGPSPAGSPPPFKIGFYGALTGNFAASGKDTINGLTLFLKGINYTAGGRKITVIVEDTAGDPNTALAKARKLVEEDKADVLVGPTLANEGYAVRDYIDRAKAPNLFPVVSGDDITQRNRSAWIIRTGWTSSQPAHAMGKWVYDQGKRRVGFIATDYAFGWENVGGFQRTFEDAGGKVLQKIWTPQTTSDFAPYFPQLKKELDAVVVAQSGGNGVRFLQQWQEFGLKGTIPLYGLCAITDEALLKSMSDEALGLFTVLHWSAALQTPEAQAFVKKFRADYKDAPGYRAEAGWVTGEVIARALRAANGNPGRGKELVDAMRAVKISDAPRGPLSFDEYGGVVDNEYIRRVDRVSGELQNVVIGTLPNVSQFWTYDPKAFLSKPVYSRDYPPCPNC
ncbi:MAG TPA: ABC transporter substrate-binding protein [Candidatus Sulfotelmatobacter sp.]|nr:ABC transporter substrate-binding protein [Candidatus Sulfotelmatobacter sp.]